MNRDQAASLRSTADEFHGSWSRPEGIHYCRVIAVTGGKGGVGKTNIAVNLSLAMQNAGARVLLFDADLGLANVDVLLGLSPKLTLQHVLRREATPEEILIEGPLGLSILPGGTGLPELANLNTLDIVRLLGSLRALEQQHDVLVIDTAAGINNTVLRFTCAAEETLVVCTPEPPAMLDAYGLIKAMHTANYAGNFNLLINMVRNNEEIKETHRAIDAVTQRYLGLKIASLGGIPRDEDIPACIRKKVPFYLAKGSSVAAAQLNEIATFLLRGILLGKPQGTDGFFARYIESMR